MMTRKPKILVSVGEASGDLLTAPLISALKHQVDWVGMGGPLMRQAGMEVKVDLTQIAVTGFFEVLRHSVLYYQAFQQMKWELEQSVDLLICVDFPGFNLKLVQAAKKRGIRVLYYISPKVWASRPKRLEILRTCVDHMAVIFPFEVEFYHKANMLVSYVGHPLLKNANLTAVSQSYPRSVKPVIALLPGSRGNEIRRLLPVLLQSAQVLKARHPELSFILPVARSIDPREIKRYLAEYSLPVQLISPDNYAVLASSLAAIVASGTATLELALLEIPMVIVYRLQSLSYWIAKKLILVKHIGLCNLLLGKTIAPELIQAQANPWTIAQHIEKWIHNRVAREAVCQELRQVRAVLEGTPTVSLPELVLSLLDQSKEG